MNLGEAKEIFARYQASLSSSIEAGYAIAAPLSFLKDPTEEIREAIKTIYTHVSYTTNATQEELEILNFGYQNLTTFIADRDVAIVVETQKLLSEAKKSDMGGFRGFLKENKDSMVKNLELFTKIQKSVQEERKRLADEFEGFSTDHHLHSSDSTEARFRKHGQRLGYNFGALYYSIKKILKGE